MKQTLSRGRFVAGTAGAAALTFGTAPYVIAAPTKEVVIGLDIPLTGPYSDQGADQQRAYNLAIEEINAHGGILGMPIRAVVADDQTKAPVARDNAERMIDRDGAVMITGGSSTGTALAVSALCQEKKTIFMATLTHGDETTNQNCHKHTFRRYNDAYMSAQSLARTMVNKYGTGKWFFITADYAWGHSNYDNITAVIQPKGAKVLNNILTPFPTTTDFSSALSQAQAAKPDVLCVIQFGGDMVKCVNQAAQFGLTKSAKILCPLVDEYMAKGAGANFDNVASTAPFYYKYHGIEHAAQFPGAKRFVDAFMKKYGAPPSNGAECAYADIYIYKMAAEKSGSLDPAKIIEVLETTKFQFTKEQEWYRKEDHQGVNSCLVVEGLPVGERTEGGLGYARVLEVHSGESVVQPLAGLKCQMEPA
ncbi:MAG: ABC transporter substrate-binding protein [Vulcanimicrobiaceae bacterium]